MHAKQFRGARVFSGVLRNARQDRKQAKVRVKRDILISAEKANPLIGTLKLLHKYDATNPKAKARIE